MPKRLAGSDLHWGVSGLTAFAAILIFLCNSSVLLAQAQRQNVAKGRNGYAVTIDQDWVGADFLRPIRVEIKTSPPRAVVDDERFIIQANSRQYNSAQRVTSAELIIPAGQTSATTEFYVQQWDLANAYDSQIRVTKAGKGLLLQEALNRNNWGGLPGVLVISDDFPKQDYSQIICTNGTARSTPVTANFNPKSALPSVGYLSSASQNNIGTLNPSQAAGNWNVTGNAAAQQNTPDAKLPIATPVESWRMLKTGAGFHYSRFADLPKSWIGLVGVDIILISLDQFKSLTQADDLQRSNLEKWVTAGGALVVYDAGPKFKKADQIWPLLLGADRDFVAESKNSLWRVPSSKLANQAKNIAVDSYGRPTGFSNADWKQYTRPKDFPKSTPFGICDYLDGSLVVVDSDMSKWKPGDWTFLQNVISTNAQALSQRIAVSPLGEWTRNANFQIPGIGEPPVKTFQILIGLFLLVAGPVMVAVLKYTRQMQYLFVAVPLLSVTVCSALLLYAVVVDGSNRWGRCNSVTHIDHKTSTAMTHARATYYCGRHPGQYEIPEDGLGIAYPEANAPSKVAFKNGVMTLSGGNISARIPHEITSARPLQTNDRLLVLPPNTQEQDDPSEKSESDLAPRVQNRLGAEVRWALIRTEDGYFVVNDLPAGQSVDAAVAKLSTEANTARSLVKKLSPQFVGSRYPDRRNRGFNFNGATGGGLGEDARVVGLLRTGKLGKLLSRPNSYVAIMEEFPLAAEQLEPVQYKMQLHVVRGQW